MYSAKFCINYSDKFNVLFSHSPSKLFEWKTDTKETDICVLVRIDVLFLQRKKNNSKYIHTNYDNTYKRA